MMVMCLSLMPKGVGHRQPSLCPLKPAKALQTTDAVRRWELIRVKVASSKFFELYSWSTENVTPGYGLWLRSKCYATRSVVWGKKLLPLDLRMNLSGIASIVWSLKRKTLLGWSWTIKRCNTELSVFFSSEIRSNSLLLNLTSLKIDDLYYLFEGMGDLYGVGSPGSMLEEWYD